jgi:hypothetical protein
MKKIFFFYMLIIPTIVFGQKDPPQLFNPMQIKADIDNLIYKLMDVHPTFLTYFILWVLNAILFSAAFRHIPFGCKSCVSSGQTKVQRTLNRGQLAGRAQRANVPER